jgi:metal-responsive CopG/Arc/MetJ family transcriptional regulator
MKVSVSLPDDDVAALDEYARAQGLKSRSAAVQRAIRMLRHPDLEQNYAAAWQEWAQSGEQAAWEATVADGLADAAR